MANKQDKISIEELEKIAAEIRGNIIEYSGKTKTPHLGSCLSCTDMLVALYFSELRISSDEPHDPDRDRFILSKGHAAPALFQVLAKKEFFPAEKLWNSDHENGGMFGEHPPAPADLPGIEAATGSLGHGMPMGLGFAMAGRLKKQNYRVFAILGDGECNEGSIWEAALLAAGQKVSSLVAFIDYNKWQATDRSQQVMALDPLVEKWKSFGWDAFEIDGNDMHSIIKTLSELDYSNGKPKAIVAHTIKGKGVDFMQDDNNWHYRTPNVDEVAEAKRQLGLTS